MVTHWSIMRAKSHTGENAQPYGLIIIEMLRGRHDVSHRCQLDCLVNDLFRQKEIIKVHMAGNFLKESKSYWWIPVIKGQGCEGIPTSLRKVYHWFRHCHTNGKRIIRLCAHDMTFKTHIPCANDNDKWYHFELMWCKEDIHGKESQSPCYHFLGFKRREAISINGPLSRYAKLRVAHASGMPGTFSPPLTSKETVN